MRIFKALISVALFAVSSVHTEKQESEAKISFSDHEKCGLTPFLYAKVNRKMINIYLFVSANLPEYIPPVMSQALSSLLTNMLELNPCKADIKVFNAFVKKLDPKPISNRAEAKIFANKINNFYLQAIGLPRFKLENIDKIFLSTFSNDMASSFFQFLHIIAYKLPEKIDTSIADQLKATLKLICDLLPGNNLSVFIKSYLETTPPVINSSVEFRQYICAMHNAFSSSIYWAPIDCAYLDDYYGPNTIAW